MTLLIGRLLIAALFIVFGVRYALTFPIVAADFARMGLPLPYVATGIAVAIQLGAGAMLALGWKARGAAWLLAVYVLVATLTAHRFWDYDPAFAVNQMAHFFKNLALIGALLMIGAHGPGPFSFGKR